MDPEHAKAIASIAVDCRKVAAEYEKSPGLVGPGANTATIIGIYLTIARLVETLLHERLTASEHSTGET